MTNNVENSVPYAQQGGASAGENPGKTLGIVGLVLGIVGFGLMFLGPIAGLIVSIIGRSKSKKAGFPNGIALAGIIVSSVALVANIIVTVILISVAATFGGAAIEVVEQCQADPTGTVEFQGQTFECSDLQGVN
jgi:MFS family permease